MSPAWRMRSDAWHEQQFNSACDAREQTNVESGANRPQCRARPERFARPQVENIGAECADRKRNWKSDQHGVNGMAGHGNARFGVVKNVFGVKWIESALGVCVRCFHRPALLGMFVLVSGCGGPLSTLDPAGPAARDTLTLLSVLLVLAAGSFLVIFGFFLLAFKRNKGRSVSLQLFLVWGGLVFPLILLTFAIVYGVVLGERITGAHERTAFRVEAQAEQWRWQFTRHTPAGSRTVANRLDIPAGQAVEVAVTSIDVIHSFWAPRLGGKVDAIPGVSNRIIIRADRPGRYSGRLCRILRHGSYRDGLDHICS